MYEKISGLIQTYGAMNVAAQILEKMRKRKHRDDGGNQQAFDNATKYSSRPYEYRKITSGRRMSVILVVHKFFPDSCGGTEQFTRSLANQLRKMGHKIAICTYSEYRQTSYSNNEAGILWREDTIDEVPIIYFREDEPKLNLFKDIERDGKDYIHFVEYLKSKFEPDLFHFTHPSRVSGLAQCCKQNHIPYIITLTDFFAFCHFSTYIQKDGYFCCGSQQGRACIKKCRCRTVHQIDRYENSKEILTSALTVAVPSQFMMRIVRSEISELDPIVVPHFVKQSRKSLNSNTEKATVRFLYVGHLSEEKGLKTLLKAFQKMPDTCTLMIYGDGRPDFVRKIKRRFVAAEKITFAGAVEHEAIEQAYQDADYVVIPSEVPETYSLVLHEALAYGRFVIASRIGAIPEAVIEGTNGFLFTPGDTRDLYEKMKMAMSLQNRVITEYNPYSESDAYAEIYERGLYATWETLSES